MRYASTGHRSPARERIAAARSSIAHDAVQAARFMWCVRSGRGGSYLRKPCQCSSPAQPSLPGSSTAVLSPAHRTSHASCSAYVRPYLTSHSDSQAIGNGVRPAPPG
eukprot:1357938-Rhodomonas_salina.2